MRKGLSGVKPVRFSWWLFEVLGAQPDDKHFSRPVPGSGAVTDAWIAYRAVRREGTVVLFVA